MLQFKIAWYCSDRSYSTIERIIIYRSNPTQMRLKPHGDKLSILSKYHKTVIKACVWKEKKKKKKKSTEREPTASRSRSRSTRSASLCSRLPRLDASILRHGEPLCRAALAACTASSTSSYTEEARGTEQEGSGHKLTPSDHSST